MTTTQALSRLAKSCMDMQRGQVQKISFSAVCDCSSEYAEIQVSEIEVPKIENTNGALDGISETGWEFLVSYGAITGEDDDSGEEWAEERIWVRVGASPSLAEEVDTLFTRLDSLSESFADRKHGSPIWFLHDVQAGRNSRKSQVI